MHPAPAGFFAADETSLRSHTVPCAAGMLAGAAHGLAFGAPVAACWQFIASAGFGALLFRLRAQRRVGPAFLSIAGFVLASHAVGLRWIGGAVIDEHALGIALGSLSYGLLTVLLSGMSVLCLGAALALSLRLPGDALCAALFAGALTVGDALREWVLPSFPWLNDGYAHVDSPFAALLPVLGVQGVGWVAQFTAFLSGALCAAAIARRPATASSAAIFACVLAVAAGTAAAGHLSPTFTRDAATLRVAVMQTAISGRDKFKPSLLARHLTEVGQFARLHQADLILTPETAVPASLRTLTPAQQSFLAGSVSNSRALLFGAFAEDSRGDEFNSAVLLQAAPNGATGVQRTVYIKQHLAPIGEYAPPGFRWITDLLDIPVSNLHSTQDSPRNFQLAGVTLIPSVCQDLLYGDDLRTTTAAPRLLVNLSNVAFFSNPVARRQFINIARARALEQQIPVVIAANFAPTVSIDARGVVVGALPADTPGALEAIIRVRTGTTPYARNGNVALHAALGFTALTTCALMAFRFTGRRWPSDSVARDGR